MTQIEQAIKWFENIADECKRLTSGNVAHIGTQIKGMARRSAEYLEKHSQAPVNRIWRDKNCIPKDDTPFLAVWRNNGSEHDTYTVFYFPYDCYPKGKNSWFDVVREYNIKQWAYVEDLLNLTQSVTKISDQVLANSAKSRKDLQEFVSEDLEKAAEQYGKQHLTYKDDDGCWIDTQGPTTDAFKAGAQWQKEQMMKDAFLVELAPPLKLAGQTHLCGSFACGNSGDKVKVIILPSDEK